MDQEQYFAIVKDRDEWKEIAMALLNCDTATDGSIPSLVVSLTKQRDEALQTKAAAERQQKEASASRVCTAKRYDALKIENERQVAKVVAAIKDGDQARADASKLREQLIPNTFWAADDPDECYWNPRDVLWPRQRGTIVEIERTASLRNIFGFMLEVNGAEADFYFDNKEEAETELANTQSEPVSPEAE